MSIKAKNLSFAYSDKTILSDISLEVISGEILTVVGPNGSGKSTFLKLLSGDLQPTQGNIFYHEEALQEISIMNQAKMRSVMTQSTQIIYDYTVREIIEMGWINQGFTTSLRDFNSALTEVSKKCDVDGLLDMKFNYLSGGEKKRVHFARTLLQIWSKDHDMKKKYILLDEPSSNLDLYRELQLIKVLQNEAKLGLGVLLIIHNLNLAMKYSNKIAVLNNGKIAYYGDNKGLIGNDLLSTVFNIPISVDKNLLAAKALSIMNSKKITSLCVHHNNKNKTIGFIHIHNILDANVT